MKQSCKSWNEEQLSDEEILNHLELLSEGKIQVNMHSDVQFNALQGRNRNQNNNNFRSNNNNNNNRNFRNGNGGGSNRHKNNRNNNFRNKRG